MREPVLEHYQTIERYMMHLPDKTRVVVDVDTSTIACITEYIIRDADTFEEIENHPFQQYVENYFEREDG